MRGGDGMAPILDVTMERWFNAPFRREGGDAAVRRACSRNDIRAWCDAIQGDGECRYRAEAAVDQDADAVPCRR